MAPIAMRIPLETSDAADYSPRQEEILLALERLILDEGFIHLTVAELAERLRCSRRTLYEIAETKDALVLLALDRIMLRIARIAHRAVHEAKDPMRRLRAFFFAGLGELRGATLAFAEDIQLHDEARKLMTDHYGYATAFVAHLIEEGIQSGDYRPVNPKMVAEVIAAGIERTQDPAVLRRTGLTYADAMEEMLSLVSDGLRRPS